MPSEARRALAEEHRKERQALALTQQQERRAAGLDDPELAGAALIVQERLRQIDEEGYAAEHDQRVGSRDLIRAAEAYIASAQGYDREARYRWPWDPEAFKPSEDVIRNLVKAGALLAAAIDVCQAVAGAPAPRFDAYLAEPALTIEDAIETASDGGEM